MPPQIWLKSEEKWAYILVLRDFEVSCVKITGNMLNLKSRVQTALEALEQGQAPSGLGAKSVETLDARTITRGEASEGGGSLTLQGGPDGATKLVYTTADDNADEILHTILAQSGKTFQSAEEEISAVEAIIPPGVIAVIGGVVWALVYNTASKAAAGEHAEVHGFRRRGVQRLLIGAAELLGTGGTIAVGVVLALLVVAWAVNRIIHRPVRKVWLPAAA